MAWDDNSADETGFQIDCSPDGVAWATIANLAADMESWTNSGLAASTTYYYRVRAVNQYGNSAWSNDDATTTAATPPSRPLHRPSKSGSAGGGD
jgi:predicted phage tail protein